MYVPKRVPTARAQIPQSSYIISEWVTLISRVCVTKIFFFSLSKLKARWNECIKFLKTGTLSRVTMSCHTTCSTCQNNKSECWRKRTKQASRRKLIHNNSLFNLQYHFYEMSIFISFLRKMPEQAILRNRIFAVVVINFVRFAIIIFMQAFPMRIPFTVYFESKQL